MEREIHVCDCQECREDPNSKVAQLHDALNRVLAGADERNRRRIAGMEAMKRGHGGIAQVARITGLSREAITRGRDELRAREPAGPRIRKLGGGRKKVEKKRPGCGGDATEVDEG